MQITPAGTGHLLDNNLIAKARSWQVLFLSLAYERFLRISNWPALYVSISFCSILLRDRFSSAAIFRSLSEYSIGTEQTICPYGFFMPFGRPAPGRALPRGFAFSLSIAYSRISATRSTQLVTLSCLKARSFCSIKNRSFSYFCDVGFLGS